MATVSWHSLPAMFFEQAERFREKPFLWAKQDGVYRPITWGEAAERVKQLARGLQAMGLQKGDRLVLVSENRPEWLIADLAAMSAGAITVPAFTTNTVADHLHILTHSGAKAAIVSTRHIARRLLPAALEAPDLQLMIAIEDLDIAQRRFFSTVSWAELEERGRQENGAIDDLVAGLKRDEVSCFIYSSRTAGTPRGGPLTQGAHAPRGEGAYHRREGAGLRDESFLSCLPL